MGALAEHRRRRPRRRLTARRRQPRIHTTGIATWFGPGFYGKKTACGQTLTPAVVGRRQPHAPLRHAREGQLQGPHADVPVLDRGPYGHIGADWDLTAGAAAALGITETVRIGTRIVGSTANTPTLGLPPGRLGAPLAGGALAGDVAAGGALAGRRAAPRPATRARSAERAA